jgi:hypothetical protein
LERVVERKGELGLKMKNCEVTNRGLGGMRMCNIEAKGLVEENIISR